MAVLKVLAERWRHVGGWLYVPAAAMDVIASENSSDLQCLRATVIYWLMHDPLASWRRLCFRFDWSGDSHLEKLAGDCRSFAEKLAGQSITSIH